MYWCFQDQEKCFKTFFFQPERFGTLLTVKLQIENNSHMSVSLMDIKLQESS